MIRAAICDDEPDLLDYLYEHISAEFGRQGAEVNIDKFTAGRDFLEAERTEPFDMVFLDIRMSDMNGFDVAAQMRGITDETYIIFITTENTLVYESFRFQPFDFIPKIPPPELGVNDSSKFLIGRISNVIKRLLSQMSAVRSICLQLPYNQQVTLKVSDIQIIQSVRNYAEYIIADHEPVRIRAKLDDIVSELDDHIFARPHKSYIINMKCIKDINSRNMTVTLKNGMIIPVSKSFKRDFETLYINFLSGFGR